MAAPNAQEQLQLELINRLRLDPDGEYARLIDRQDNIENAITYFGVDLSAFRSQMDAIAPSAALAWNDSLGAAAEFHSGEMIRGDEQSHQLPGEPDLSERVENAGYRNAQTFGENVFAFSEDPLYGHAGFVIDWGYDGIDLDDDGDLRSNWQSLGDGIQDAAGHRVNMVSRAFTEVGIDVTRETDGSTSVGEYVITQNFGTRFDAAAQFVGVVIDDADADDFYDIGEGMGGVTVSASGGGKTYETVSWESGGWQIEAPAGTYTLTFSGGELSQPVVRTATLGDANVKIDVEKADAPTTPEPTADREDALAVARLYGGAFGRQPDEEGVNFWIDRAEEGQSRLDAAVLFLDSLEFTETFGNDDDMTNTRFVETMYRNVLSRENDASGLTYWVEQMDLGLSREQTLLFFADSQENIDNSTYLDSFTETSDGVWEFV